MRRGALAALVLLRGACFFDHRWHGLHGCFSRGMRILSHAEDAECAEARIVSLACGLRGACFFDHRCTDKQMKQKTNSAVSTIRRLKTRYG